MIIKSIFLNGGTLEKILLEHLYICVIIVLEQVMKDIYSKLSDRRLWGENYDYHHFPG